MSVTGTPTTPVVVTNEQVRMFLRDKAELNILLDHVQFSDRELFLATEMTADAFNAITPQSNFSASTFPNKYVLLLGTCKFLMMSETFLQLRNQATIQDGDIAPIGIDDKQAAYAQLAQLLKAEFDELVRGIKTQNNMEGCYGSLSSGYRSVARFNR